MFNLIKKIRANSFLKFRTKSILKRNKSPRASIPYKQATSIGIIFSINDKVKHEYVKELMKRFKQDGKDVTVMTFLPKGKENLEYAFDCFTEHDLTFWGSNTSKSAIQFAATSFDYLLYLDTRPVLPILNILARSKAKCRVGRYWKKGKPYFEFMVMADGDVDLFEDIYKYMTTLY